MTPLPFAPMTRAVGGYALYEGDNRLVMIEKQVSPDLRQTHSQRSALAARSEALAAL